MSFFWQNPVRIQTSRVSFSPTLPSNTGVSANVAFWQRDGKDLLIDGQLLFSGAGPGAAITITLPNSLVIDTAFLPGGTATTNPGASNCGNGDSFWFQAGVAWKSVWPKYVTTTTVGFWNSTQAFFQDQQSAGSSLNYRIRVPIVGWS